MAKAREPKVFRSMDDLPLMLTPYDLMDFLGKGQRQTYELIHSEGFPYVQDGPKIKIPKWLLIEFINEKVRKGEPLLYLIKQSQKRLQGQYVRSVARITRFRSRA